MPDPKTATPEPPHPPLPERGFAYIGLATVALYGAFLVFYGHDAHQQPRLMRELFIWPGITGLLALYWLGYRHLLRQTVFPVRPIVWFAGFIGLMALLITPFHSTDLYGYINRGWQQVAYGLNPYVFVVDDIAGWEYDPMFTDHWVNNPCPYGFLFALIAKMLCIPAQGNLGLTVVLFKLFNLAVHGLTGLIVWKAARRVGMPRPEIALYLYLFNPLILLHQVANGHNDLLMGLFIALGAYMAIKRAWAWVIPALVAGTLIKYAAALLLPFAFAHLIRQAGWRPTLLSLGLGIGLLGLLALPFAGDLAQAPLDRIGANATLTHNSLHAALYHLYKEFAKWVPMLHGTRDTAKALLKYVIWSGLLGFLAIRFWQAACDRLKGAAATEGFVSRLLFVMFVGICVASSKFYPWYLGMFFPLALMLPAGNRLRTFILVLSGFQLFAFTFIGQAHILNYLLLTGIPMAWALLRLRPGEPPAASIPKVPDFSAQSPASPLV